MESKPRQLEFAKRIAMIIILLGIFCNLLKSIQAIKYSNRFELKKKKTNKQTDKITKPN